MEKENVENQKPNKKNRTKPYQRHQRRRVIEKKKRIYLSFWKNDKEYMKPEGHFGKGKVHCSCPCCSEKTRVWGYKKNELAKINAMKKEMKDYLNNDFHK